MRIAVDMDDVLTQTNKALIDAYNRNWDDELTLESLKGWNYHYWVKPECGHKVYEYLNCVGFYYNLEPVPWAIEGMHTLLKEHDVLVVTASPIKSRIAIDEKRAWLTKHMPWFPQHNLMFVHRKDAVLADILFDDGAHNLMTFEGVSVCMNRPWNRGEDCADYYVDGWLDFSNFIAGFNEHREFVEENAHQRLSRVADFVDEWRFERDL